MWHQGLFHKRPWYIHVRIRDLCQCGHYPAQNSSTLEGHLVRISEKPALIFAPGLKTISVALFGSTAFPFLIISIFQVSRLWNINYYQNTCECQFSLEEEVTVSLSFVTISSQKQQSACRLWMDVRICLLTTVSMMFAWIFQKWNVLKTSLPFLQHWCDELDRKSSKRDLIPFPHKRNRLAVDKENCPQSVSKQDQCIKYVRQLKSVVWFSGFRDVHEPKSQITFIKHLFLLLY